MSTHPKIVVMGVAASGKTTVGLALAAALGLPFTDADSLHTADAIARMTAGIPLTDDDRAPWLERVGAWLAEQAGGGVVACSALRRSYRDTIRGHCPGAVFLCLHGDIDTARVRTAVRRGHFMPTALVESQFETYEPLSADEAGTVVDFRLEVAEIVRRFRDWLGCP